MIAIAARPGSSTPQLVDVPYPSRPQRDQILCRTLQLGICGTDREILLSEQPAVPHGASELLLGHECLGIVESTGADVASLRPGDLVVPVVRRALPQFADAYRVDMLAFGCFTERGIFHEDGFSAAYWLDRPEHVLKVPPHLESVAVLAEPLAVSEKAVNEAFVVQQARIGPHEWRDRPPRVLVTGQGPIGFTAVLAAVARGWPTTMVGRDAADTFRAELATRFGARYQSLADHPFAVRDVELDGYDLVLECTGSDEIMLHAVGALASRGVMVWLGSTRRPEPQLRNVEQMMRDGILRNHLHLATVNSAPRDFVDALAHLDQLQATHPDALAQLITARVAPADSLWHYLHRLPQGIKTVVEYP
ncbi:MAG: alcohol dehydrogenase catalytic domain-containing protein [Pirellulales bacterium]